MSNHDETRDRRPTVVIVGSSVASVRVIEALRREGWSGGITAVTDEDVPFYNRPPLSKEYLLGERSLEEFTFLDDAAIRRLDVDVRSGTRAEALDLSRKVVVTDRGDQRYDSLVIATGARARTLPTLSGFSNVYYLRNIVDAEKLRASLRKSRSAIVIGFGFIGCEFAASALRMGVDVTIVDASLKPYAHFGRYFSDTLTTLHRNEGAKLVLGSTVVSVQGGGCVEAIELDTGEKLSADMYVVAIGARPNTEWLSESGLIVDDGVVCDATLQAAPGVYAAGDVARWPHPSSGALTRVEHWTNAVDQAATVAYNVVHPGVRRAHAAVPYFWSTQFGRSIQYLGFLDNFAQESWFRSASGSIAAVLGKEGRVRGIIGINAANVLMRSRPLVTAGAPWASGLEEIAAIAAKYSFEQI